MLQFKPSNYRFLSLSLKTCAVCIISTTVGCSTGYKPAYDQALAAYRAQMSACLAPAAADPVYSQVALHFNILDAKDDTNAQREDLGVPSQNDATSLTGVIQKVSDCGKLSLAGTSAPDTGESIIKQGQDLLLLDLKTLSARQETWGEFVTTRDTIETEENSDIALLNNAYVKDQPLPATSWQNFNATEHLLLEERASRPAKIQLCRGGFRIDCIESYRGY